MRICWSRFEHAKRTTGKHARERRRHKYGRLCSQCRCEVTPTTKVAAHLISQPCFPCSVKTYLVLKTTCKRCNNRGGSFWGCCVRPVSPEDVLVEETSGCACWNGDRRVDAAIDEPAAAGE
jgi:hypothetical protein